MRWVGRLFGWVGRGREGCERWCSDRAGGSHDGVGRVGRCWPERKLRELRELRELRVDLGLRLESRFIRKRSDAMRRACASPRMRALDMNVFQVIQLAIRKTLLCKLKAPRYRVELSKVDDQNVLYDYSIQTTASLAHHTIA
jgi:hypothetical protein